MSPCRDSTSYRRRRLANRLLNMGRREESEALLEEAVEESGGLVAERLALVEFYRRQGEGARAAKLGCSARAFECG